MPHPPPPSSHSPSPLHPQQTNPRPSLYIQQFYVFIRVLIRYYGGTKCEITQILFSVSSHSSRIGKNEKKSMEEIDCELLFIKK